MRKFLRGLGWRWLVLVGLVRCFGVFLPFLSGVAQMRHVNVVGGSVDRANRLHLCLQVAHALGDLVILFILEFLAISHW